MKPMILIAVAFVFLPTGYARQTSKAESTVFSFVADQYYWTGPEGNLGIEFVGKFQTEEKLIDTLNLVREIGTFKAKKYPFNPSRWNLRDVLISTDLNASGNVATWRVSGPKPLLLSYLEELKKGCEDKTVFYDFGYTILDIKPTGG
jgi:hypothetical protein